MQREVAAKATTRIGLYRMVHIVYHLCLGCVCYDVHCFGVQWLLSFCVEDRCSYRFDLSNQRGDHLHSAYWLNDW